MATTILLPSTPSSAHSTLCPNCNYTITMPLPPLPPPPSASSPEDAYARIRDLEAQVKLLNSKAAAAVDKLADYEDEVRFLRAVHARSPKTKDPNDIAGSPHEDMPPQRPTPAPQQTKYSSFSSFLPGRRNSPATQQPQTPSTPMFSFGAREPVQPQPQVPLNRQFSNASSPNLTLPSHDRQAPQSQHQQPSLAISPNSKVPLPPDQDLSAQLALEHAARLSAEKSLSSAQTELEELTAQLFGQANEMVAAERKARAKLEERVRVLEKRDGEKRKRLERLERAVERIDRVRRMVK